MATIICTLFEGNYHHGLAALTNSLYKNGFRGEIFAGYRGSIPPWALKPILATGLEWQDATYVKIADGLVIYFLPLDTERHLTNYKPDFTLRLLRVRPNATAICYFDPDIVLKCNWQYIERWLTYGVALVHEIVNYDMGPTHPTRQEWKDIIVRNGFGVQRNIFSYINAGFYGLKREHVDFIKKYKHFLNVMEIETNINLNEFIFHADRTHPFFAKDQDALNIAAMCCDCNISEVGPDGMDFQHGGYIMSHSTGSPKPWNKNFLLSFLDGRPPSSAEKAYWGNVRKPITLYSSFYFYFKLYSVKLTAFLGRCYRRY